MIKVKKIGTLCNVQYAGDYYPAIFLEEKEQGLLCYVLHIDMALIFNDAFDINDEMRRLLHVHHPIEFSLMESPSFFKFGQSMYVKWGNIAYNLKGRKVVFSKSTICDKVYSTPVI